MIYLKKILFIIVLLAMFFPLVQWKWKIIDEKPLKGIFTATNTRMNFSWYNWFSGEYQRQNELHINDSIGLRSFFVRVHNQIDFSLFHKANAEDLAVGKFDFLHSPNQINAHLGKDFIGKTKIDSVLYKVQFLQKTLKAKNINLLLVFAPGKPTFYSENYPVWIDTSRPTLSNYTYYIDRCKALKIEHIDFNKYFLNIKDSSRFPLYPKCGIHWSFYGATLATDSILKYIEKVRHIDIPDLRWKNIETENAKDIDYDCGDVMNLLWRIKGPKMAYVQFEFEENPKKTKPNVLVVADSYFWNINNMGIPERLFNDYSYWYYNSTAYAKGAPMKGVKELNLKQEIERKDVIIILATEVNLYTYGFGFIENAYNLYKRK
jgi:hypothetical protein